MIFNLYKKIILLIINPILMVTIMSGATYGQTSPQNFKNEVLMVKSKEASHSFQIEIAANDTQRAYGLMFRNELDEMAGMLFIYDQKKDINMWMKNTLITLDIIFINEEGKIINISQSAQPMSLTRISSGGKAKAVLELNGGTTKRLGIDVGDEIIYAIFENTAK